MNSANEDFSLDDRPRPNDDFSVYDTLYRTEPDKSRSTQNDFDMEDEGFKSNVKMPKSDSAGKSTFAFSPVDPRYYQQVPSKAESKIMDESVLSEEANNVNGANTIFEKPRSQRQNPNLAASKAKLLPYEGQELTIQKFQSNGKFNTPMSLVPTTPKHQHVIQQALKNSGYTEDPNIYLIYVYAMIAGIGAAATVAIGAFVVGWYTMRKKTKAADDVEYPAYGITGPNTEVTPSGDRQLAHSAQMYHYQHQKQQIIAMESHASGAAVERAGSLSDAESEEENDEGDYTVYECPGFATTGEMEVKNPLFHDEPTPATPAQQVLDEKK